MDRPPRRDPAADLLGESSEWAPAEAWRPAIDVYETAKGVVVRVEIPGVRAGDVKVTVDGDLLVVRGVRRPPEREEAARPHRLEIAFGRFERRVRIAVPFEKDRVAAELEDGFLTIELPRPLPVRRRIEVQGDEETPA